MLNVTHLGTVWNATLVSADMKCDICDGKYKMVVFSSIAYLHNAMWILYVRRKKT